MPILSIKMDQIKNKNLSDLIIIGKLESSKSEVKRLIKNNAVKINNAKIQDDLPVSEINLENKNYFKLSIGKKKHFKIEINYIVLFYLRS